MSSLSLSRNTNGPSQDWRNGACAKGRKKWVFKSRDCWKSKRRISNDEDVVPPHISHSRPHLQFADGLVELPRRLVARRWGKRGQTPFPFRRSNLSLCRRHVSERCIRC